MRSVAVVDAEAGRGLVGDRYHGTKHRHVTIQSQQLLERAGADLGRVVDAGLTRRNLTVDTGEIPARPGTRVHIAGVELEVVRVSAPCRLLDDGIGGNPVLIGADAGQRRHHQSVGQLSGPQHSGGEEGNHAGPFAVLTNELFRGENLPGPPGIPE